MAGVMTSTEGRRTTGVASAVVAHLVTYRGFCTPPRKLAGSLLTISGATRHSQAAPVDGTPGVVTVQRLPITDRRVPPPSVRVQKVRPLVFGVALSGE